MTFRLYTLAYAGDPATLVVQNEVNPLKVVNANDLERALEEKEGRFRIGNMTAEVRGLDKSYFDGADAETPVVFEMTDGAFVYHGYVDVEEVEWIGKSGRLAVPVLSWEAVLAKSGAVPARSVYETDVLGGFYSDTAFDTVDLPADALGNVGADDTLVIDLGGATTRAVIWDAVGANGRTQLSLNFRDPDPIIHEAYADGGAQANTNGYGQVVGVRITDADAVRRLRSIFGITETGYTVWRLPEGQSPEYVIRTFDANGAWQSGGDGGGTYSYVSTLYFAADGSVFWNNALTADWSQTAGVAIIPRYSVEFADKATILGGELYGHSLIDRAFFDPIQTVEAMCKLGANSPAGPRRPFGVFANLVRNVSLTSGSVRSLPYYVELSNEPLAALREIQRTTATYVDFVPALDNGVPRIDVEIRPRAELAEAAPVGVGTIKSWREKPAKRGIRAVVVRPNVDYFEQDGDAEWVGIYDGAAIPDDSEFPFLAVPEGDDVVEIEVLIAPARRSTRDNGDPLPAMAGGSSPAYNDDLLRSIAEDYFRYYSAYRRTATAEIAVRDADLVGKRVTLTQGDLIAETGIVLKSQTKVKEGAASTTLDLLLADNYVAPTPAAPVAVIDGQTTAIDGDGDGDADLALSGARSYALSGEVLSYQWEVSDYGAGVWTPIGSASTVEASLSTGVYEVRLTVTGATSGLSGSTTVTVVATDTNPESQPIPDPFGFRPEQSQSGTTGTLRLYFNDAERVEDVLWRRATGENLSPVDWDANPSPTHWYDEQPVSPADFGTDSAGTYAEVSVPLSTAHLSFIEVYVRFYGNVSARSYQVSFDADTVASFQTVGLSIDTAGDVRLTAIGDEDTADVVVLVGLDGDPLTEIVNSPFANPIQNAQIYDALPSGSTLEVQVQLRNQQGGTDGVWTGQITNTSYTGQGSVPSIYFQPSERTDFTGAPSGTLFFDDNGDTMGLNIAYDVDGWARVVDEDNSGDLDLDFLGLSVGGWDVVDVRRSVGGQLGIGGGGTLADDVTLELVGQALSIHTLDGIGFVVRTGPDSFLVRQLVGTQNQVNVVENNGQFDDVFFSLPQDFHTEAQVTLNSLTIKKWTEIDPVTSETTVHHAELLPEVNYTGRIGRQTRKFLELHVGSIIAEMLVTSERRATVGGRFTVGLGTELLESLEADETHIVTKHNNLNVGDVIHIESPDPTNGLPRVEFLRVTSGPVVKPENAAPTALLTAQAGEGRQVTADASGSSDEDGTITQIDYDWGDGNTTLDGASTAQHTYAADGSYTITLTVTDDDGATGTDTFDVTISAAPPVTFDHIRKITIGASNEKGKGTQQLSMSPSNIPAKSWDKPTQALVTTNDRVSGAQVPSVSYPGSIHPHTNQKLYELSGLPIFQLQAAVASQNLISETSFGRYGNGALGDRWDYIVTEYPAFDAAIAAQGFTNGLLFVEWWGGLEVVYYMSQIAASDTTAERVAAEAAALAGLSDIAARVEEATGETNVKVSIIQTGGDISGAGPDDDLAVRQRRAETDAVNADADFIMASTLPVTYAREQYAGGATNWVHDSVHFDNTVGAPALQNIGADAAQKQYDAWISGAPSNAVPTAALTLSDSGLTVTADASTSSDSDGTIDRYDFDWGDGNVTNNGAASENHTYATAGTYDVTVTVTDDDGATDSATAQITVTAPSGQTIPVTEGNPNPNFTHAAPDTTLEFDWIDNDDVVKFQFRQNGDASEMWQVLIRANGKVELEVLNGGFVEVFSVTGQLTSTDPQNPDTVRLVLTSTTVALYINGTLHHTETTNGALYATNTLGTVNSNDSPISILEIREL